MQIGEDIVFKLVKTIPMSLLGPQHGSDFYYGEGTSRRYTEIYPWLGIIKYKANNTGRDWYIAV